MSAKSFLAGPFSSVYVGTGGTNPTDVLVQLTSTRTKGARCRYENGTQFLPTKGSPEQTDSAKLIAQVSFIGTDDNIMKLASNNPLSQPNADDPSSLALYTVLMIHPNPAAKSLLLVNCWTDITVDLAWQKGQQTECPLVFRGEDPNRFVQLYYLRPAAQLKTILGSRWLLQ